MLIDIHTHLDHPDFESNRDTVVSNAEKAGVKVILSAGTDPASNRAVLAIAQKYSIVKPCLGVYPIQKIPEEGQKIKTQYDFDIDAELDFIRKQKDVIASIGEVGLDYKWTRDFDAEQKLLFEKMISLSEELNKPIIVHSRSAEADCVEMLASSKNKKIVMHCFSGKKKLVKKIIDNGWFLTAPTNVVRSPQFQENVSLCPITQLFCETDAPFLSPFQDKKNEPAFISEAYRKVAEIKRMEYEEVVNNLWMNWQRIL